MMPSTRFCNEKEVANWMSKGYNNPKIKIIPFQETQSQIADIMRLTDCGVFPSRAEGWGLGALEMMACGKYNIVTNYSGFTEFCDKENSLLIDIDNLETAYD